MKQLILIFILGGISHAAIARDGECTGGTTTCTLNATATGDLQLWWAYKNANTAPTLPSGVTQISVFTGGSDGDSWILAYKIAASSSDTTTNAFTGATRIVGHSYSGAGGLGATGSNHATASTTMDFPALTLTNTNNTSWVAVFGGTVSSVSPCTPTGLTSVTNGGSSTMTRSYDTNATVSSWPDVTCTVASATWVTAEVEITTTGTAVQLPPTVL